MNLDSLRQNLRRWWPAVIGLILLILVITFVLGQLNKGSLEVSSNPAGAEVSLNGSKKGITPTKVGGLDPGTYEITAALPGFVKDSKQVKLSSGQTIKVSFDLLKAPQEYVISSDRVTDVSIANGQVLYNLSVNQRDRELWSFNIATKQKVKLLGPDRLRVDKSYWASSGQALVTDFGGDAYLLANGNLTKLSFRGYGFSWSPDNKTLAFANDRFFGPTTPEGINTYDTLTGKLTNIVSAGEVSGQVTGWSPDGNKIFYHNQSLEDLGEVTVVNKDGSSKNLVINDTSGISRLVWSADSQAILANKGGVLYSQPLSKGLASTIFDSTTQDITFTVSGPNLIVVGSRETGQVWKVTNQEARAYHHLESGSITEIAASDTVVVISSTTALILLLEN